jgi:hypothetical protein
MLSLGLAFTLFLFWTLLGRALIAACGGRGILRSWLLAPAVGLAAVSFGLLVFNQAGLPIRSFGRLMTFLLLAGALVYHWRQRPVLPWKALLPFGLVALACLAWTGWPAAKFGFNWISYSNDDMANYCLAAQRFCDFGFFEAPNLEQLLGRDYTQYYWFMHAAALMRFGSEHLVAWTSVVAGIECKAAFMPSILALMLAQLFSAAGLVLHRGNRRRQALVGVCLLAASPLFMLGTLYELIAQVGGLTLLLASVALLTALRPAAPRWSLFRYAILPGLTCGVLCIFYPEVTPFAGLTFIGFLAVRLVILRQSPRASLSIAIYTLVWLSLLLRHNLLSYVVTLLGQGTSVMRSVNPLLSLFPYFMIPSGMGDLFGWMPISHDFPEPIASLTIGVGIVLLLVTTAVSIRQALRLSPVALLFLVQLVLAFELFATANDFGLYKLAMFFQPALTAALAWCLVRHRRRGRAVWIVVAAYIITTVPTALSYTIESCGLGAGGLTEMRLASQVGTSLPRPADANAHITSSVENVVAAKFAAMELRGDPVKFVSRDYFSVFLDTRVDYRDPDISTTLHPHYVEMAKSLGLKRDRNLADRTIETLWSTEFSQSILPGDTAYYLSLTPELSLFNKFGMNLDAPVNALFVLRPTEGVKDLLVFVHSGRGNHYYLGERNHIAFFQQERDPFEANRYFNGLGRFLLFRVERPSGPIYLRVAATRTVLHGRTTWSRGARVLGATSVPFGELGDGAFNRFVGPLQPLEHNGAWFVAVDFFDTPRTIVMPRTGLKGLYNREIPLDYRQIIGWARDFSAVSADQVAHLVRPMGVYRFPDDLVDAAGLEFAGAYEDGWLSPYASFVLGPSPAGGVLHLRGSVPPLLHSAAGPKTMHVTLNGAEFDLPADPGAFDWLIPVPAAAPLTRLTLRSSASAPLPGGDDRPVSAQLERLEVLPAWPGMTFDFSAMGSLRPAAHGVDQDGWFARHVTLDLPALASAAELSLKFQYPSPDGKTANPLRLQLSGLEQVTTHVLEAGTYSTVTLHVPASFTPRTLTIEAAAESPISTLDPRSRAARLLELHLAPTP